MSVLDHPAMPELIHRYRAARRAWATSPRVRAAAAECGWQERDYCERYIGIGGPIYYAATDTRTPFLAREHHDAAFEAAGSTG